MDRRLVAAEVPNLDGMGKDELREFADRIGERSDIREATRNALWRYALLKADAIEQREAARIVQALRIEGQCERVYVSLPRAYRW